jgi:hypothetical protein
MVDDHFTTVINIKCEEKPKSVFDGKKVKPCQTLAS